MMGAEARVYLPNRFRWFVAKTKVSTSISLSRKAFHSLLQWIMVAGNEAIAYAQEQGVDVIVTDHHSMPAQLPDAFCRVHPEHPDADYPFKYGRMWCSFQIGKLPPWKLFLQEMLDCSYWHHC